MHNDFMERVRIAYAYVHTTQQETGKEAGVSKTQAAQ